MDFYLLARPTGWAFGLSSVRSSDDSDRLSYRLACRVYRNDPCLRRIKPV